MDLHHRIDIMVRLGEYMQNDNEIFKSIKQKAQFENPWFTQEFIDLAVDNITNNFLQKDKLETWAKKYNVKDVAAKNIGIVMSGNIPLVGFHDLLSVFISGHNAAIKPSSKDEVLIKHLVQKMIEWDERVTQKIFFAFQLKGCDAYIATGSNNSARYFEYYFNKYPSIIRRNRTSLAVIDNTETKSELEKLADDIQTYFGLGCRNVTKLYVPSEYDFIPLLNALKKYDYFLDFHKYKHNYDYQLALLIMNSKFYMNNGSILLTENLSSFSPVSQMNYEYYSNIDSLDERLKSDDDIQCIVGHNFLNFGMSQSPQLNDYADGIDTMKFLSEL
jgi:hypothetical protein